MSLENEPVIQMSSIGLRQASAGQLESLLIALQLWYSNAKGSGEPCDHYISAAEKIVAELERRDATPGDAANQCAAIKAKAEAGEWKALGVACTKGKYVVIKEAAGTYAAFKVQEECAKQLEDWCKSQGIKNAVPGDKMHCTTVYSSKAVPEYKTSAEQPEVDPSTYQYGILGGDKCLVLYFDNAHVRAQHQSALDKGATWEHDGFRPHITLSYDCGGSTFGVPPSFPIKLGNEYTDALRTNWAEEEGLRTTDKDLSRGDAHVPGALKPEDLRKGFPNGVPEIGVHVHTLERENKKTKEDGAHAHLFNLPDGSTLWSEVDGEHAHPLKSSDAEGAEDGAHSHTIVIDGKSFETEVDGPHEHQLQVWTTAFDGVHIHKLKLPAGVAGVKEDTTIANPTPGEYWAFVGKPSSANTPPSPPAPQLAKAADPQVYKDALVKWSDALDMQRKAVREPVTLTDVDQKKQLKIMIDAWSLIPSTQTAAYHAMLSSLNAYKQYAQDGLTQDEQVNILHTMEAAYHALLALTSAPHSGFKSAERFQYKDGFLSLQSDPYLLKMLLDSVEE